MTHTQVLQDAAADLREVLDDDFGNWVADILDRLAELVAEGELVDGAVRQLITHTENGVPA